MSDDHPEDAGGWNKQETEAGQSRSHRARLVVLSGDSPGRIHRFSTDCIIGRSEGADFQLSVGDISRKHVQLIFDPLDGWRIKDLDSSNGTWLDGVPLDQEAALPFGARIQLGQRVLLIFTHRDVLEEQVLQMQKLESLGRLAGETAHDLRNLLAVYRFNLGFIKQALDRDQLLPTRGLSPVELEEVMDELLNATDMAGDLTSRLLGYARLEDEDHELLDVSEVLEEVAALAKRTFPADIMVSRKTSGSPLLITGAASRIKQALMNLCVNARDAMPDGGELRLRATRIRSLTANMMGLPGESAEGQILISVEDTGAGMNEAVQAQIFEPFFTTKARGEGTGLGLATVYSVVEEHGGKITVKSTPGHGTSFALMLPAGSRSGSGLIPQAGLDPSSQTMVDLPRNFLVISGATEERQQIKHCLDELGLSTLWEDTCKSAVTAYRENLDTIAGVLVDVQMQDMLLEEIVGALTDMAADCPIILMVPEGEADERTMRRAATAGVHAVLAAPITTKAVHEAITHSIDQFFDIA